MIQDGVPIHLKFVRLASGEYCFGLLNSTFHAQLVPAEEEAQSAGELSIYPGERLEISGYSKGLKLSWEENDVKRLEQIFSLRCLRSPDPNRSS